MVTEQTETLITVVFDNGNITKKFMCPAVFGQFLTLCSPEQQGEIEAELKLIHDNEEAKKRELREKEANSIKLEKAEQKVSHSKIRTANTAKNHPEGSSESALINRPPARTI